MTDFNWSAYEKWNDALESKNEGSPFEVNRERPCDTGDVCALCGEPATKSYEIKRIGSPIPGTRIDLCSDHASEEEDK